MKGQKRVFGQKVLLASVGRLPITFCLFFFFLNVLSCLVLLSFVTAQVVVSGPSGFVFYVETILADMGVPSSAIVLLD